LISRTTSVPSPSGSIRSTVATSKRPSAWAISSPSATVAAAALTALAMASSSMQSVDT